jgi:hypothetical protein
MRKDGGDVVRFFLACMRRTEKGGSAPGLARAHGRGTRMPKAIRIDTLRRGSVTLALLPHNGRHLGRGVTTVADIIR